ncbi:MAG: hypothetical protein ABI759_26460 [Candidatus Solibacter sp.]
MAGDVQLPPGNYEVKLEGNSALLTNVDKDKTYSAPVKVESEPDKYKQTALLTGQQGGESYIQAIEFGGSHTRLVFGE